LKSPLQWRIEVHLQTKIFPNPRNHQPQLL